MRYLKLYLETSVWNFYYADDAPEKREVTRDFFHSLPKGGFDIYISEIVLAEIEKAGEDKRSKLIKLMKDFQPTNLLLESAVRELVESYLENEVLPQQSIYDAYHIAFASVNELDFVVSWNLQHIANAIRQEKVHATNL